VKEGTGNGQQGTGFPIPCSLFPFPFFDELSATSATSIAPITYKQKILSPRKGCHQHLVLGLVLQEDKNYARNLSFEMWIERNHFGKRRQRYLQLELMPEVANRN
jgi:hypothetical protein